MPRLVPCVILAAAIILSTIIACLFMSKSMPVQSAQQDYTMTTLNEISDKIKEREVIEYTYFHYISDQPDLTADMQRYNELTASLKGFYTNMAVDILLALFEPKDDKNSAINNNASGYLQLSPEMHELKERIAKLALYKNCTELLVGDPKLAYIIERESGGSYGLWPYRLHKMDENVEKDLQEYFELEAKLIDQLEKYKDRQAANR